MYAGVFFKFLAILKSCELETQKISHFNCSCVFRWNDLSGQNFSTMKKLKLVLKECWKVGWPRIRQKTENLTRKYYSMEIASACRFNQETVVVMSKHTGLRQLELFVCQLEFKHHKELAKIIQNLRKLEVLKLNATSMKVSNDREPRNFREFQLPSLKTLVIHDSSGAVSSKRIRIVVQWSKFFHFLLVHSVPGIKAEIKEIEQCAQLSADKSHECRNIMTYSDSKSALESHNRGIKPLFNNEERVV